MGIADRRTPQQEGGDYGISALPSQTLSLSPVSRRALLSITIDTISRTEHEAALYPLSSIHQPFLALSTRTMSHTHPNASSSSSSFSNFQLVLNAALDAYEKKTKTKLLTHPLATQFQSCDSPTAVSSILEDIIQQFDRRRRGDERLTNWLNPTINVLYAFSSTLGQGLGIVSLD